MFRVSYIRNQVKNVARGLWVLRLKPGKIVCGFRVRNRVQFVVGGLRYGVHGGLSRVRVMGYGFCVQNLVKLFVDFASETGYNYLRVRVKEYKSWSNWIWDLRMGTIYGGLPVFTPGIHNEHVKGLGIVS